MAGLIELLLGVQKGIIKMENLVEEKLFLSLLQIFIKDCAKKVDESRGDMREFNKWYAGRLFQLCSEYHITLHRETILSDIPKGVDTYG